MSQPDEDRRRPEPTVMNTAAAAAYLDMKPGTLEIWRSIRRDGPPYIKVGRCVKYRKSDLDGWLDARTCNGKSGPSVSDPKRRRGASA